MKETKIAKEKVQFKKDRITEIQNLYSMDIEQAIGWAERNKDYDYVRINAEIQEHKATCQRWLEFLIRKLVDFSNIGMGGYECDELCKYKYSFMKDANEKIKDLQSAIKLYEDAGIK